MADKSEETCKHCGRHRDAHGRPLRSGDGIIWSVNYGKKGERKVKYPFALKRCPGFSKKD